MKDKIKEKLLKGCGSFWVCDLRGNIKECMPYSLCLNCESKLQQHKETKRTERERIELIILKYKKLPINMRMDLIKELKKELEKNEI